MKNEIIQSFEFVVSHYQLIVSDRSRIDRFNDWREAHVKQGFSWRPGCVSFGTLDILNAVIDVCIASTLLLRPDAIRVIRVPFSVGRTARVEVATTGFNRRISVPPGEYALTFEHGLCDGDENMWCVLTFVLDDHAEPAILAADSGLSPPSPLLMEADPA